MFFKWMLYQLCKKKFMHGIVIVCIGKGSAKKY